MSRVDPTRTDYLDDRPKAALLDLLVQVVAWVGISLLANSGLGWAIGIALLIFLGYPIAWELLTASSPGKLAVGMRVVDRTSGERPSFTQVLLRNLIRPVDALPCYAVGMVVAAASEYRQRIGDHLAGTAVVITEEKAERIAAEEARNRAEREALAARRKVGDEAEARVMAELSKLAGQGYYLFCDLMTEKAGNIDHLVVGPEGVTVVETKANRGAVECDAEGYITVGGEELHRDPVEQVRSQISDLHEKVGRRNPEKVAGLEWIVCFPKGRMGNGIPEEMRPHLSNAAALLSKLQNREHLHNPDTVEVIAYSIWRSYGRRPTAEPLGSDVGGGSRYQARVPLW